MPDHSSAIEMKRGDIEEAFSPVIRGGLLRLKDLFRGVPIFPLLILLLAVLSAIFADFLAPYNPIKMDLGSALTPPTWPDHPLGTDALGRDILSRILYGGRISLVVGIGATFLAAVIGVVLGLISGYLGGPIGELIMRVTDAMLCLPPILIALVAAATIGPSLINVILIIGFIGWAGFSRMVRGEALSIKEMEFVALARVAGCGTLRMLGRQFLPNVMNTVIVLATLRVAGAVVLEATLSFLSVGVPPPTPSWGLIIAEGRNYLGSAWWIVTFPGLALMLTVLSINLLGDWLRDRLDPRLRQL